MKKSIFFFISIFVIFSIQVNSQSWSALTRLTWNSGYSAAPTIAADPGGGLHVVWQDSSPGSNEIFYKNSIEGGTAWSGPTRLTWTPISSLNPSIDADPGNNIHVVWEEWSSKWEIIYKHSTDRGNTWSGPIRLTYNSGVSSFASIAADSLGGIHVVWGDNTPGNHEIFYKNSFTNRMIWSNPTRLSWTPDESATPVIAVDKGNRLHVAWCDITPGSFEIFYKVSQDGGTSWSALTRLTWNSGVSGSPSICTDPDGVIHLVWQDNSMGNYEIFYRRSTDYGTSWSGITRLTWNFANSLFPITAAGAGSGVHVVWQDSRFGKHEIFHRYSTNGGVSWSVLTRLTWSSGETSYPHIAADSSGGAHVVWEDDWPGNMEILYKNRK